MARQRLDLRVVPLQGKVQKRIVRAATRGLPKWPHFSLPPTCFPSEVGEEFDAALRTMAIFLKDNMELAGLITLLNGIGAKHADQREHPEKCRENAASPQWAADAARLV
jgi:hypothetical protein